MTYSEIDSIPFALLTWSDLDVLTRRLAHAVRSSERQYDRVLALAQGGLTMARHFVDLTAIPKLSSCQISFYKGIGETNAEPSLIQPVTVPLVGERVLILEDLVDTGATVAFARDYVKEEGAAVVDIAALIQKSHTQVEPDFVVETIDRWIIYPYETHETIRELSQRWQQKGWTQEQRTAALSEIGFDPDDISVFAVRQ